MEKTIVFFDRRKSVELKGTAILFMFWLHLYGHDKYLAEGVYYTSVWGGYNLRSIRLLTSLFSICVPLYLFVAGYGEGIKNGKVSVLPKIKALYFKFYLAFAAMIPLCLLNHSISFSIKEFFLNLTGFYYSYCGEWWFFGLYIELKLMALLVSKIRELINKNFDKYLIVSSFFLMMIGYCLKLIFGSETEDNLIINNIYMFLIEQPIFISGYLCGARKDLFNTACKKLKSSGLLKYLVLLVWLIKLSPIPQGLYTPFIIPVLIALFTSIKLPAIVSKVLSSLGANSVYMWLTHSFFIYKFPTQFFIYRFHVSIINLLILLLIDLPVAVLLNMLERKLHKIRIQKVG